MIRFIFTPSQQIPAFPLLLPEVNCCEGDILLLLDSSGSISNYEFAHLLRFAANLLSVFSLGRGHVRVGLLQVGTDPILEFRLDVHTDQRGLQEALGRVQHLQGDTNTVKALREAQQLLRAADGDVPKILLWLTDGACPGDVGQVMSELKAEGAFVLAVSTVHGNYWLLRDAVSPPLESHFYVVDIDSIEIITEDLRDAIISMCACACMCVCVFVIAIHEVPKYSFYLAKWRHFGYVMLCSVMELGRWAG